MQGTLTFSFPYYAGGKKQYLCYSLAPGASSEHHKEARKLAIHRFETQRNDSTNSNNSNKTT